MYYLISNLCPRTDVTMGRHYFHISLHPGFKQLVEDSQITQEQINFLIANEGRAWLDACGYDSIYDPDNSGIWADPKLPPGPRAEPLYKPRESIRVIWGEWGPHHITVPGNACGLDLEDEFGSPFKGGKVLSPHNIDSWQQKNLFLIIFTEIANCIVWASSDPNRPKRSTTGLGEAEFMLGDTR